MDKEKGYFSWQIEECKYLQSKKLGRGVNIDSWEKAGDRRQETGGKRV